MGWALLVSELRILRRGGGEHCVCALRYEEEAEECDDGVVAGLGMILVGHEDDVAGDGEDRRSE